MRPVALAAALSVLAGVPLGAQTSLTLDEAMTRARADHPSARAALAGEREAEQRITEARAGYFPRVDFAQAWQRGNQPVFVFSTLLSQRRFAESNFAVATLNRPDPIGNWRSAFSVEQAVFDGGMTRLAVRSATLGQQLAREGRSQVGQNLALAAAQAYVAVAQLQAAEAAAHSAVEAGEADLERARNRRDAGMVTEADVLDVSVQLGRMRQQLVQTSGELAVARARLNQAIGAPLDAQFAVILTEPASTDEPLEVLEREALERRPEARAAAVAVDLASTGRRTARAVYLPQVGVQGSYELNGEDPTALVSGWMVAAQVQVNLFRGFGDQARVAAAVESERRQTAERERIEQDIRLEVRSALARLAAARARAEVGRAALDQARESQRILRDRYESGLVTVTDILRAGQAVLQAESDAIAARGDAILQSLALQRAVGRL